MDAVKNYRVTKKVECVCGVTLEAGVTFSSTDPEGTDVLWTGEHNVPAASAEPVEKKKPMIEVIKEEVITEKVVAINLSLTAEQASLVYRAMYRDDLELEEATSQLYFDLEKALDA